MVIKAAKATVEANKIVGGTRTKHHQTNTHNAQTRIAKGTSSSGSTSNIRCVPGIPSGRRRVPSSAERPRR